MKFIDLSIDYTIKMHQQKHKQKQVFLDIVQVKKVELQNNKKSLSKHQSNKLKIKINTINPEANKSTNRIKNIRGKQSPRLTQPSSPNYLQKNSNRYDRDQFQQMREQHLLKQNARNFILKLKKQRQENKGKFLMLRKKQQQRKQREQMKQEQVTIKHLQSYNIRKMQKMINNIILHQSRIDYRQSRSLQRVERKSQHRSKTENSNKVNQQEQKKYVIQLPLINLPPKKLSNSLYLGNQE